MFSAIQQHTPAIIIRISPPSWAFLSSPHPLGHHRGQAGLHSSFSAGTDFTRGSVYTLLPLSPPVPLSLPTVSTGPSSVSVSPSPPCDSVQFSGLVVSDSLRPHRLLHARPPCPSSTPEFTQTHVHWVGNAIQPSHPLLSPSPPTFNLSLCQGLFKCVGSSHQVVKVLELQLQHQSSQWTPRTDL